MKTVEQIQNQVNDIYAAINNKKATPKEIKTYNRRLSELLPLRNMLEVGVTEESLKKQQAELLRKIERILDPKSFNEWYGGYENKNDNNPRAKYNTIMNLPGLQKQLKNIEFLLA